jgi:hypothetical protein
MINKPLFLFLSILALASLACGVDVNLPNTDIKTGPTQTLDLNVQDPGEADTTELTLAFGVGKLSVGPGAQNALVTGTATFNVEDFRPEVITDDEKVRIEQGDLSIKGIPDFNDDIQNEWDLKLGSMPFRLIINAGAYSGKYEFGGLALESLEISDGAADVDVEFSEPNPTEMDLFRYNTGASNVSIENIANSNTSTFIFQSGAGNYQLDFSGELKRDMVVNIESGISTLVITMPEGVPAQVTFEGGFANVDSSGAWEESGSSYQQEGSGPRITIIIEMGAGTLQLRNK